MAKNRKNQVVPNWRPQKKNDFTEKPKKSFRKNLSKTNEKKPSEFFNAEAGGSVSSGFKNFFIRPSRPSQRGEDHNTQEVSNKSFREVPDLTSENGQGQEQLKAEGQSEVVKKPFDKKKYRLKKYSKKYKLDQWGERRKAAVVREYYKQIKDDHPPIDVSKIYNDPRNRDSDDEDRILEENENNLNAGITQEQPPPVDNLPKKKPKPFERAQREFQRLRDEKQRKQEEFLRKKAEKETALKKYRQEKAEKYKKLSRRTKKGQPIMKDRMEMLLEKIQNSMK